MKLFICWSGDRSRALAEAMKTHLPEIIQDLDPFVSTAITKGTPWFQEVAEHLQSASAGLICLTRESVNSSWIHYEAGILARAVSERRNAPSNPGRIFTYLLDVDPTEVVGPLSAYQSTVATRDDTRLMIESMVDAIEGPRDWLAKFEEVWPKFEKDIANIERLLLPAVQPGFAGLFKRKTFDEPLPSCTGQRWCDRFAGALETRLTLQTSRATIESACREYVRVLFDRLLGELDGYAMDMSSFLLDEREFAVSKDGSLAIQPRGIEVACEKRRLQIKRLVSTLLDASRAPVLDQSCAFAFLETFEEKKNVIHSIEARIAEVAELEIGDAKASDWDLDRIGWHLVQDRLIRDEQESATFAEVVDSTRIELEKVGAQPDQSASLMPLHYSLAPIQAWLRRFSALPKEQGEQSRALANLLDELRQVCERVSILLDARGSGNWQLRLSLREVQELHARVRATLDPSVWQDLAEPSEDT